ncbi:MAG: hypothetical protein ABII85_02300 [Bacillota bacterium]
MLKKILFSLLIIQVCLLSSCIKGEPVTPETLVEILGSLTIRTDLIMVNRIYTEDWINVDQIEMLDMRNKDATFIHIIVSSNSIALNRDEMIMITPDWIYTTRNMTKTALQVDISEDVAFYTVIDNFTDFIDFEFLSNQGITDLGNSLIGPVLTRNSQKYTLRGQISTSEALDSDIIKIAEIIYENNVLVGLNIQYEHTFRSTMQQSNYISGIHYFFGEKMIGEFPSLSNFA